MGNPIILDGKKVADEICVDLKTKVDRLKHQCIYPMLTIVTSGSNEAGSIYIRNKKRRCEEIGIKCNIIHFDTLNARDVIVLCGNASNPTIFQSPIVSDNPDKILSAINATLKYPLDADGFTSMHNVGCLVNAADNDFIKPCTPAGIMYLLKYYNISVDRKTVCIIGRSNIVGRPLSHLMEQAGATTILCHSQTKRSTLINLVAQANIIVSATGVMNILKLNEFTHSPISYYCNKTYIDVGMNRTHDGKLCGDFDPKLFKYANAYTPVPGGVGPMTVAMLMKNVVDYYIIEELKRTYTSEFAENFRKEMNKC